MKHSKFALAAILLGGLALVVPAVAGGQEHQTPTAPAEFLSMENPIPADEMDEKFMKKAARVYKSKCRSCHGQEGDGKGSKAETIQIKPVAFVEPGYMASRKDGQLFWIIMYGSPGTEMEARGPGTRDNLTEREIWSVIAYLRHAFTH